MVLDELIEVLEHELVIALWLKVHLGPVHVQVLEQSEYLPQAECDSLPLELILEQLGIDLLFNQEVGGDDLKAGLIVWIYFIFVMLFDVLPNLLFELFFELE